MFLRKQLASSDSPKFYQIFLFLSPASRRNLLVRECRLKMHIRAKLRRFVPELLQQFSVAGVWQQLAGPRIALQLLIQVRQGEGVHHRFLWWSKKFKIISGIYRSTQDANMVWDEIQQRFLSSATFTTRPLSEWITALKTQVDCLLSFWKLEHSQCYFTSAILSAATSKIPRREKWVTQFSHHNVTFSVE